MGKSAMEIDFTKPLKLADRIWWVGHYIEGDAFQCHSYLIENGRNSILFDPGSRLTFKQTFAKIEEIVPFSHIRYFVVHHQDPDITGALDIIDQLNCRDDAVILSHWRAIALLKHLDLNIPLQCVEEMGWELQAGERTLEFIFTPYLHFPGAFCSFDPQTGSLFSSDLMGGFTEGFSLFAKDKNYLESIRLFHEHYMPSREILASTIRKFEKLPLKLILPQHGSIIRKDLIPFILDQMKDMDCGLYLLTQTSTEVKKLSRLNRFMNDFMETLVIYKYFDTIAVHLLEHIKKIMPARDLRFLVHRKEEPWKILEKKNRYRGTSFQETPQWESLIRNLDGECSGKYRILDNTVILPLSNPESGDFTACALLELEKDAEIDDETKSILDQVTFPLSIAIEREMIQQHLDTEKQAFYEMSIKDNLTGLYNRTFMNETIPRLLSHHDRGVFNGMALLMLDLDHFKQVNDTFGHLVGDQVLKKTAQSILGKLRSGDLAVRVGGEEFAIFLILEEDCNLQGLTERMAQGIREIDFTREMGKRKQTISGGLAIREKGESLEDLIGRADFYLYESKKNGRDRITAPPF